MTKFKDKYRIETARRPGWDYATEGWYFVTICTANRQCYFGEIVNGEMVLTAVGETAVTFFQAIPKHTQATCSIDEFVVMPNHIHGIIAIVSTVETLHCNVSTNVDPQMSVISPKKGSLSAIIRSYKSAVSYWCRENEHSDFGWQPRFHDRIIRNERELNAIRAYIHNNPGNWVNDRDNEPGLYM